MYFLNLLNRSVKRFPSKLRFLFHRSTSDTSYIKRKTDLDWIDIAGVDTNYNLSPVLVSHGLFSNKKEWIQPCKELNLLTGRKVICYDAVNHGDSSQHSGMSYFELAHDVHMFLTELNIQKKVIHFGHRMGGKTASSLALAHPDKVSHLILIDSAPCIRSECVLGDTTTALKLVLDVDMSTFESKEDISEKLRSIPLTPLLLDLVLNNVAPKPAGGFKLTCNLHSVIENYNEIVSFPSSAWFDEVTYDGPTLFIGDISRSDEMDAVKKRFPNVQLHHVEDIDYNIHLDMPKDILSAVSDFLNSEDNKSDMTKKF